MARQATVLAADFWCRPTKVMTITLIGVDLSFVVPMFVFVDHCLNIMRIK